jgi:hypothetical protein
MLISFMLGFSFTLVPRPVRSSCSSSCRCSVQNPSAKRWLLPQARLCLFRSGGAQILSAFRLGFIRLYRSALSGKIALVDIAGSCLRPTHFLEIGWKVPDDC